MKRSLKSCDLPLISLFTLSLAFILLPFVATAQQHDPKKSDQKYASALQIIRFAYVDTVNEEKLTETAIAGMLKELDPHSTYMSKKEVEAANEPLQGNFEGIGVQFEVLKDTIIVVTPIPGGPSEKLGILAGDKIVKIEGENSTGPKINNDFVLKRLRGTKGTQVTITIYRKAAKGLLDYTITRDKIPIYSVDATYMAAPGVGYIKLNKFSATTMDEFQDAIKKLHDQGMKSLILDLQNNSGGYLNTAIDLADQFLPKGKLAVYTEGFFSPKQESIATDEGEFESGRLVVLVNEGSASASEILAGAVQDWDRAIVIGRRTFGKGLVQRPYTLTDGSVIRLTTAHYYTPTGRCVQKPYNEGVDKYYEDLTKRYKHGELIHPDSIKFPDSLKYYTPNRRVVYGGGGIMPDIFIPLDTTLNTLRFYTSVIRKGILNEYVQDYLAANREKMKSSYPNAIEFIKGFNVTDDMMTTFVALAEKKGVKKIDSTDKKGTLNDFVRNYYNLNKDKLVKDYPTPDAFRANFQINDELLKSMAEFSKKDEARNKEEDYQKSEKYLKVLIKARLAQNLYDYSALWQVYNETDDVYNKALQVIQDKNKFKELKVND
jgi:carboxyl-terminal processing protease